MTFHAEPHRILCTALSTHTGFVCGQCGAHFSSRSLRHCSSFFSRTLRRVWDATRAFTDASSWSIHNACVCCTVPGATRAPFSLHYQLKCWTGVLALEDSPRRRALNADTVSTPRCVSRYTADRWISVAALNRPPRFVLFITETRAEWFASIKSHQAGKKKELFLIQRPLPSSTLSIGTLFTVFIWVRLCICACICVWVCVCVRVCVRVCARARTHTRSQSPTTTNRQHQLRQRYWRTRYRQTILSADEGEPHHRTYNCCEFQARPRPLHNPHINRPSKSPWMEFSVPNMPSK